MDSSTIRRLALLTIFGAVTLCFFLYALDHMPLTKALAEFAGIGTAAGFGGVTLSYCALLLGGTPNASRLELVAAIWLVALIATWLYMLFEPSVINRVPLET